MGSLHHLNGGTPQIPTCHYCTIVLGDERAVANTPSGPRYFAGPTPNIHSTVATSNIVGGSIEEQMSMVRR
jgi:hypothetical protein